MIRITVNGEERRAPEDASVLDVLEAEGVSIDTPRGIAVALNDGIVRRGEWSEASVAEGDRIEIVTARQGG
jgi:sulfur carrier protein